MKFRAFDVAAVAIALFVLLLPEPTHKVRQEHEDVAQAKLESIAALQAQVVASPKDVQAAVDLSDALIDIGATEAALRSILPIADAHTDSWLAQLSAADAWVQNLEFPMALPFADRALKACYAKQSECPADWRVRLAMYRDVLKRVVDSKVDVKMEPEKLHQIVAEAFHTFRLQSPDKQKDKKPDDKPKDPTPAPPQP